MKQIVIIGSGLGGLECGALLSEAGYRVTVLEQAAQIGGCLQSYERRGYTFDTGFHYVGGIEEGQVLHPVFKRLGLLDLPWEKLDEACADQVVLGQERFALPQGYERFLRTLSERFPKEKKGLQAYVDLMRSIADGTADVEALFGTNAYDYLMRTFSSETLRDVISGASLRTELRQESLPLYSFACINNSFVQSAYRLRGGGQQIANRLAETIRQHGGEVLTHACVSAIIERNGRAMGVRLSLGETVMADIVVSDIALGSTMDLISEESSLRKVYRKRLANLPLTGGIFTTSLLLSEPLPQPCATHIHTCSPWSDVTDRVEHVLVHTYPDGKAIDLLTPVTGDWVALRQHDMAAYEARKEAVMHESIALAKSVLPELDGRIEEVFTSSPATYQRYLAPREARGGTYASAFGIRKDCQSPMTTLLSPKTPLEGLYLTGQNLHLHGIMGTSMTAIQTVENIIGRI